MQRADEPPPAPPPGWYTSQEIRILQRDGVTLVKRAHGRRDGTHRVALRPGRYIVTAPRGGVGGLRKAIPITIRRGHTTRLDLDIDTGIR